MAYKTLLFGTDDLFETLKPFYLKAAEQGTLEIVAAAVFENGRFNLVTDKVDTGGNLDVDIAIISSQNNFYDRMKQLEALGIPRNRIIDGKVFFRSINLNFPRLLNEGVAYDLFNPGSFSDYSSHGTITRIYPRVYITPSNNMILKFDTGGYMAEAKFEGTGLVSVGKYCSISWEERFKLGVNGGHNYRNVSTFGDFEWPFPAEFWPPQGLCKILIGSDVWIGRGCILKVTNPNKPLIIGDGAVIASDSVVVKSIPPYAIVGGNPAKIIKYRFEPHVIESLLRIKWWDWDIDKIHDNFKYFNDVEKFISLHDK